MILPVNFDLQCFTILLCVCARQCALAALNDVRQYLGEEGGQVAVSPGHEHDAFT